MGRYLRLGLLVPLLFAIIIDAMGFGLVYPMLTAIFTEPTSTLLPQGTPAHLRDFFLSLGYFLFPLCMIFGASFMGDLSDVWGRRKVITLCMAGICISFLLMALGVVADSVTLLMVGRGLSGLMAGSQAIALAAITDLSPRDTKGLNLSIGTISTSLGIVIGPLIAGIFSDRTLSSSFGLSTPFFIAAVLALIGAFWVAFGFRETFKPNEDKTIDVTRPFRIFIDAFAHKQVRLISLIFLLMQIGFGTYFAIILVHLRRDFGYRAWEMGMFNAWLGIAFIVALLIVPRLVVGRWKIGSVASVTLLITGLGTVLSSFPDTQWILWVLGFIVAGCDMLAYTALLTVYSNIADQVSQGWVMGVAWAVVAFGWTIAGALANLLPAIGASGLIAIGGILILISGLLMGWASAKRLGSP